MELLKLPYDMTVCKVEDFGCIDMEGDILFIGKTDEEMSVVCETSRVPSRTVEREDGWKGFRIQGVLDFSLIGILSKISSVLADAKIGIFAVSTYNTDYILVKADDFDHAADAMMAAGYSVVDAPANTTRRP